jgi:hypothetical protein
MREMGFTSRGYDFLKDGVVISFGSPICLDSLNFSLDKKEEDGAYYYEISIKGYLSFYEKMLQDEERQKKKGNKDRRKIRLIKEYMISQN